MNRQQLKQKIAKNLERSLSIHLASLPFWGVTLFLRDLHFPNRRTIYIDAHVEPIALPQAEQIDKDFPTTFIIDHFDNLFDQGTVQIFNHLKGIFDINQKQVTYLICTNHHHNLIDYTDLLGNFFELATESRLNFPTMTKDEINRVIDENVKSFKLPTVTNSEREKLWQYSGGIPGLAKWSLLSEDSSHHHSRIKGFLLQIWHALNHKQQADLINLTNNKPVNHLSPELEEWGLVNQNQITSTAIRNFIKQQTHQPSNDFSNNNHDHQIESQFTQIEHRIFQALKKNLNQLCDRHYLISSGWPDDQAEGVSNQALDQIIARLRKKLKTTNFRIKTIRGRGYTLTINH